MDLRMYEGEIKQVVVHSHQIQTGRSYTEMHQTFVLYKLSVRGSTPFMHSMARFDRNACLPLDIPMFNVVSRYSHLHKLHHKLVVAFPAIAFPEFPPKRWMRNTSPHVIEDRKRRLNSYFRELLKVHILQTAPDLVQFFCAAFTCRIAVIGASRIGKASLVDAFCLAQPLHRHTRIDLALNSSQLITTRGPIEIIVDSSLIRISRIETFTVRENTDNAELISQLRRFEAVLIAYSPLQPTTSMIANSMAQSLKGTVTSLVSMGSGDVTPNEVQHADHQEEIYNIFEDLARKAKAAQLGSSP